jgi:hypothetical protein
VGYISVESELIGFRIDERKRQIDHVLTAAEQEDRRRGRHFYAPKWDYEPTGELRLHLIEPDSTYTYGTWKDGKRRGVEDQIISIMRGLFTRSQDKKRWRNERELKERQQRKEEELERERSKRRERQRELIEKLELQAGAWMRARMLRAYIRVARKSLGQHAIFASVDTERVNFFEWAQCYVDQLDPLHPCPRNDDLTEPSRYCTDTGKFSEEMSRISGHDGQQSWKLHTLGATDSVNTEGTSDGLGRSQNQDL